MRLLDYSTKTTSTAWATTDVTMLLSVPFGDVELGHLPAPKRLSDLGVTGAFQHDPVRLLVAVKSVPHRTADPSHGVRRPSDRAGSKWCV